MKYASAFRSILHVSFIAYADIVLSINLFVFLFPLCLTVLSLAYLTLPYKATLTYIFDNNVPYRIDKKAPNILESAKMYGGMQLPSESLTKFGPLGTFGVAIDEIRVNPSRDDRRDDAIPRSISAKYWHEEGVIRSTDFLPDQIVGKTIDNFKQLPESKLSSHPLATKVTLNEPGIAGGLSFSEVLALHLNPNLLELGQGIRYLYAENFVAAQIAQAQTMDLLSLKPMPGLILFPWRGDTFESLFDNTNTAISFSLRQRGVARSGEWTRWAICNGDFRIVSDLSHVDCDHGTIVEATDRAVVTRIITSALSHIELPFAPFILSSFGSTVIFYLSLYIFIIGGYCLKGIFSLLPVVRDSVDIRLARQHSISIIFVVAGFALSIVIAVWHNA